MNLSAKDQAQIEAMGIDISLIETQINNYKTGFPFMNLVAPATPGHGIIQISDEEAERLATAYGEVTRGRQIIKFVPASGAASRMFKSLFELREMIIANQDYSHLMQNQSLDSPYTFFSRIREFAFYDDLALVMKSNNIQLDEAINQNNLLPVLDFLLGSQGLNSAALPKGLLKFHLYHNEPARTALEEHLVEAAHYACDLDGIATVHFTVSPEHLAGFEKLVSQVKERYENQFGIKFQISFSSQKPSTDIIAVDLNNEPFRNADGSLLFRPGGHGALIENLNDLDADLVFVKNIDNVVPDRLKAPTFLYKKVIGAMLVELQTEIFRMLVALENPEIREERLQEMAVYCNEMLNLRLAETFNSKSRHEKVQDLQTLLNRPIRICGMVKNEGEPGGGPFWVKERNGRISLQIVESAQINRKDPAQESIMQNSTHFNPVDLVCGLKNYKGENFHLPSFVDAQTGFISEKSKDGKALKAQELPGLWNGAMNDWITLFVEVPLITFNPVKVINDLLRKEHLID